MTLLAIALFVAFIKGGPAEMWAWLARTLTGDPAHASTVDRRRPTGPLQGPLYNGRRG